MWSLRAFGPALHARRCFIGRKTTGGLLASLANAPEGAANGAALETALCPRAFS